MTFKEALEYLRPVYENAQIYNYAVALGKAIEALELAERRGERYGDLVAKLRETKSESKRQMLDNAADAIEALEAELAEERYRHDRYVDYATERDRLFERLLEDFRESAWEELCHFCKRAANPVPCYGADYICDKCSHEGCVCHACEDYSKWEWRGTPEVPCG